ncbi:SAF domain-containing protein [Nocardioides sp. B-3]|uniref:SAF domain-containing protein n=1 Tax=Nocardioides sp. B-3 TaxID=2895565 RepID=UPI00215248A3|nr:SAF domain-containing protein [Nocardioides sp. B-3]UUZ60619.1 SAF domain-containing protein [Nocardioides sp. B-3]
MLDSVRRRLRALRRAIPARRRPPAALLVAMAVLAALRTTVGPGPPTVEVPVAARDPAAGSPLTAQDVSIVAWPADPAPDGLTSSVAGQVLAAPLRRGEAITDRRFVGSSLAEAHPELTVLPLRLPDPAVVELLRVGDRIDLSSVDPETGSATELATDVPVLAIPPPATTDSTLTGRLIVAGITPEREKIVSAATVREFLTVAYTR